MHVSVFFNWYCWFILQESCDSGAHTGLCAHTEGLRAAIMQQDLISCSPDLCFFPPIFFYLTDSSSFSSCPDQFPLWRPFSLIIHTRIRNQRPQYPLCGNHGAIKEQFRSNQSRLTKQSYLTRWGLHPAPVNWAAMIKWACAALSWWKRHWRIKILLKSSF